MARDEIGSNPPEQPGHFPKSPGLPAGYTSHILLYNSVAETLILELRASSRFLVPIRSFVRHKDTAAYEQISAPLQSGLRFLSQLIPASPSVGLTASLPLAGSDTGLPCFVEVTR